MFPVDTVKTRIQVSPSVVAAAAASVSSNSPSRFTTAFKQGSLYKGVLFSLVGQIPYGMLTFGMYETIKANMFKSHAFQCPEWLQIVIAASLGDAIGSMWLNPSELIKSKTQAGLFASPIQAVRAISKNGPLAFYQGYAAAIARDVPFRAIQFTLFEYSRNLYKQRYKHPAHKISPLENLLLGALSGTLTAMATTPLDVIRTRMMAQATGPNAMYKSAMDCLVKTVTKEGAGALMKGVIPRCLLIGPSSAVFFLAYEASKSFFRSRSLRSRQFHVSATPLRPRRRAVVR